MTIRHLQLVVPDALNQLHLLSQQADRSSGLWALQNLLESGQCSRLWDNEDLSHARVDSWQQSLLCALPIDNREYGIASARLSWTGEGGLYQDGSFFHAMPVCLEAGLDDVRWRIPPPLDKIEADAVFTDLQPLISSAGFKLLKTPTEAAANWYLWTDKELTVNTFSLRHFSHYRLRELMPKGSDAPELRRLMTEVQMLLHAHPVNQKREINGILPVNALWFYGHAPLKTISDSVTLDSIVMSNSAYVNGLCQFLNTSCLELSDDIESLLHQDAEKILVVLPKETLSSIERHWLRALYPALLRGQVNKLDIHLDYWRISLWGGRWAQLCRRFNGKRQTIQDYLP